MAALVAVQSALADRPGLLTAARGLSHFGEHSIGWVAVSVIGAVLMPRRRGDWLVAGAGAFAAHAAAVLIKRVVRRKRPHHPAVAVNVGTPSQLSFPSAHATSTTAAAILMGRATGLPLPVLLVPPMALSRILLGVHYPSDVAFGIGLGAAVAGIAVRMREMWRRVSEDGQAVVIGPPANLITGVVKAIRPRQWVKNVLVLAAPLSAAGRGHRYDYGQLGIQVSVAFVVFSLAASAVYLINDVRDVEADREHPTKRFRPIAAGVVPEWLAYALAVVLAAASLGLAWWLTPNLAVVMAVYIGMQLGYCFGLKHQAVMDICIVSSAYSAPGHRRGRGHRYPAVAVVFADHGVRVAVHGGRQALRRAATGRAHRRGDPQGAGKLHQHLSAIRLDVVGHRGGDVLRAVGLRA